MEPFAQRNPQLFDDLAARYGVTPDGVAAMFRSVAAGNGQMAQFDHPDFGGAGQWMRGGMTMVANISDSRLKARVDGLCSDLAQALATGYHFPPAAGIAADLSGAQQWWPPEFGMPDSAGAQNNMRYAYFAKPQRLAIRERDRLTIFDTLDHRINGVAQAQSTRSSLTFSTDRGIVDLAALPVVADASTRPAPPDAAHDHLPFGTNDPAAPGPSEEPQTALPATDPIAAIQRLAELRSNGILSNDEFAAKKAELLRRI